MNKFTTRILIVEDDPQIRNFISYVLSAEGFASDNAATAQSAMTLLAANVYDLMLLDLGLPDYDGMDVIRKVREWSEIPILVVSARDQEKQKVEALDLGANDYITKPFNPMELVARVKSQLRRYLQLGSQTVTSSTNQDILEVNGLRINTATKQVFVDGKEVRLTPTEFKILSLLMRNKGRVFSISDIYENVWDEPGYNAENTVAVHIRKIREKIEINPRDPRYLKVVWGIGYKIEA